MQRSTSIEARVSRRKCASTAALSFSNLCVDWLLELVLKIHWWGSAKDKTHFRVGTRGIRNDVCGAAFDLPRSPLHLQDRTLSHNSMHTRRVSETVLHRTRVSSRSHAPPFLGRSVAQSHTSPTEAGRIGRRFGSKNTGSASAKFSPPTEAASVLFPGKDLRVSRVGFGSPWIGAARDRSSDLSRALSDGQCNLVQLTSEVKRVKKLKDGKPLLVPEWPERSWETRTFENIEIPREDLVLLWELSAAGKPVKEALSPARAMEHLDHLLIYHGLDYVDAFVMEIPMSTGGESMVNDYRRFTGEAVRLAMTEFVKLAGDRVRTIGFSWQGSPHTPHPGRAPDSPLSDVIELRDLLTPSKPVVAMFPVGVGCGVTLDSSVSENAGVLGLTESAGVFQIGTNVTHTRRPDGRPFRLLDVNPRPVADIMVDLKSLFGMTIHMELEYARRFDVAQGESEGKEDRAEEVLSPLPPKADVSWGHILAQNQHKLQGLDEWEIIRDSQIKPSVTRALDTLRIKGGPEGQWGFLYRSTLGSLMAALTEVMEVRKQHQLEEVAALMDQLAPSLRTYARGSRSDAAGTGAATDQGPRSDIPTVIGRCTAAALGTGVDCVLDEGFSASRERARVAGFEQVPCNEVHKLYSGFKLPTDNRAMVEQ